MASPAAGLTSDTSEETKKALKRDSAESDNAVIVNSVSSPQSKSPDQLKVQGSPALDATPLAGEEFVLVDCQTSKPSESLDSLIGTLKQQIRSTDWLEKNTPELSAGEDPELLDVFKDLLQRARE